MKYRPPWCGNNRWIQLDRLRFTSIIAKEKGPCSSSSRVEVRRARRAALMPAASESEHAARPPQVDVTAHAPGT